jgi:ABC-2 type transport system ATP-binding protein
MLQIKNVYKSYGSHVAVHDISFQIKAGEIFGLLGPNGAGKSSLLRMITGITHPDRGEILFNQEYFDLLKHSAYIGYMPEERGLYKKMKVRDQAIYLAQLKGLSMLEARNAIQFWFEKLDMMTWANKKVEDLSKGMSQKLQFVTTVAHNPKLLILDEPFSGLDPVNSEVIKQEIFNLASNGTSIIFSTHRMEQVEEICNEIALINKGKMILNGNVQDIKQNFKQNLFSLKLENALQGFEANIRSQDAKHYILQFETVQQEKELLDACLKQHNRILEYREILPSLHEIFIREIEGNAITQF